ncbi:MAG: DUF6504 family protein [Janthinobacterium lividum]
MRRFSDEVHVRSGSLGDVRDVPVQFVWRGRLYLVREVLSRWRERSAWWEHSAVAAVHGDDPTPSRTKAGVLSGAVTDVMVIAPRRVLEVGDLEREVFRVEAGVGRAGVIGVYDLARPAPPGTAAVTEGAWGVVSGAADSPAAAAHDTWQLLRVSD